MKKNNKEENPQGQKPQQKKLEMLGLFYMTTQEVHY